MRTHAAGKAAVLVPASADPHAVAITQRTPSAGELAMAAQVLAAAPSQQLLYARVDLVPGPDGTPVLMELELTEPSLFLSTSPGAADRFATAIAAAVGGGPGAGGS